MRPEHRNAERWHPHTVKRGGCVAYALVVFCILIATDESTAAHRYAT
jgi:hypothetical protein